MRPEGELTSRYLRLPLVTLVASCVPMPRVRSKPTGNVHLDDKKHPAIEPSAALVRPKAIARRTDPIVLSKSENQVRFFLVLAFICEMLLKQRSRMVRGEMTEQTTLTAVLDHASRSAARMFRSRIAVLAFFAATLFAAPPAFSQSVAAPARDTSLRPPAIAWVTRPVSANRVVQRTFQSAAAKTAVSYHLYLPAAYDREPGRRFPVVYWLHGSGGGLAGIPAVARHFDEAIQAGKTPPCLVVFVNGLEMGMYVDWSNGAAPVETVIVRDLVSHIDATYRTVAAREGRLLDGFSMGGYGAARFGFKYPEMFRAISIMGAGPLQETLTSTPRASKVRAEELLARVYGGSQARFRQEGPRTLAKTNATTIAKGSLVRMVIGSSDETYENNAAFHDYLDSLKIPHDWIVLTGVGHDPEAVLKALGDANWSFYRKAFGAR